MQVCSGLTWLGVPNGCKFSKGFWRGGRQAREAMRYEDIAMRQMDFDSTQDWRWSRVCIFAFFNCGGPIGSLADL